MKMFKKEILEHRVTMLTFVTIIKVFFPPAAFAALSNLNIPDRPKRSYVQLGDINLGGLFAVSSGSHDAQCGKNLRIPILQQQIESVVFAVNKINKDKNLLPNIKLGFALLDECGRESTAASQALRFLPRIPSPTQGVCPTQKRKPMAQKQTSYNTYGQEVGEYYDVVGIIGPLRSSNSVAVSNVLGPARVPQISFLSTSDVLSRKNIHPYFLRVVPADAYQMETILKFISLHGWSFFSVLYEEGSYGEPAYEVIKRKVSHYSLCIAAQHKLYKDMMVSDYRNILLDLMKYTAAKVVVLVAGDDEMMKTFQAVHEMKAFGRFIWIGSDGWADRVISLSKSMRYSTLGAFTTTFYAPLVEEFNTYFRNLKPSTSKNPWFGQFWEQMFNCSFRYNTCNESMDITQAQGYTVISQAIYGIDAVYTYAHALHNLISDQCSNGDTPVSKANARGCVSGALLLKYLKNVTFHGYTGLIDFNQDGDRNGKYVIRQLVQGKTAVNHKEILTVDVKKSFEIENLGEITWDFFLRTASPFGPNASYPRTKFQIVKSDTPISVCSRLCKRGEQKVLREPSCCWDCRYCRMNEMLVSNSTKCEECPDFHWPDEMSDFTSCLPIAPTYPVTSDPFVVILISLSIVGMLMTALILYQYILHRNARVIKASSRELSFLQLGAIFYGYLTMLVYVMRPSNSLCITSYFMFCLSFTWLYAPLLIKTIRIYRIFQSAKKGIMVLRFVSPLSQVALTVSIILGQIIICVYIHGFSRPHARLKSPIKTEKYVELYCDYTNPGLLCFIAYNMLLVCLCTVFAFKTRKLPDNFNESRFISMCVFTTLVIWLAIVPSFVTASREYLRMLLLAAALLLNNSVNLIFLFASRLYAVFYVDDAMSEHAAGCGTNASNFQGGRSHNSVTPINAISNSSNLLMPGSSHLQ